jgi:hypothetical protein
LQLVERVAGKPGGGYLVLELLSLQDWQVSVIADGAGGVTVLAAKFGLGQRTISIERSGPSVAEVAVGVFEEALAA